MARLVQCDHCELRIDDKDWYVVKVYLSDGGKEVLKYDYCKRCMKKLQEENHG